MPFANGETLRKAYARAQTEGYALMANNITEPNILIALIKAYSDKESDLVLQLSPEALEFAGGGDKFAGLDSLSYLIRRLAETNGIFVFLNLDHFTVAEMPLIEYAIRNLMISSVMIDASRSPFEENIRITRRVVELAAGKGILVEGELGMIRGAEGAGTSDEAYYTDPEEAVLFVQSTGIDLLAISIGTQHGVSKGRDIVLRTDIATHVRDCLQKRNCSVPLVLHGTSGLLRQQYREVIKCGITKLNISTLYQYEYTRTAADFYIERAGVIIPPKEIPDNRTCFFSESDWKPHQETVDLHTVGTLIRSRVYDVASSYIDIAGSANKTLRNND